MDRKDEVMSESRRQGHISRSSAPVQARRTICEHYGFGCEGGSTNVLDAVRPTQHDMGTREKTRKARSQPNPTVQRARLQRWPRNYCSCEPTVGSHHLPGSSIVWLFIAVPRFPRWGL